MARDARVETAKNTLVIQGYVLQDDGMVALSDDGFLALICLWSLVSPEDQVRFLTGQTLIDTQEEGTE